MDMQRVVLFDLDGTLTDPGLGITNSVMYSLNKFGIRVEDRSELYKFIGPPLLNSFMEFYSFDEEQAEQAVIYYREYFKEKGMFENKVYDGIPELLEQMKKEKMLLVVATSKPEPFAVQILEHFNLSQYFDVIAGSDFENVRNTKTKVIAYALEQLAKLSSKDISVLRKCAIMVGDRSHDVVGAKENDIQSIGVLFGYGDREELEGAGADFIVEQPSNIWDSIADMVE